MDAIAAFAVIFFFVHAIASYSWHGHIRDTDNQFRDPTRPSLHAGMWALILVEIAGFSVLLAGFVEAQII